MLFRSNPGRPLFSVLRESIELFVEQAVAHALIADDHVLRMKESHDPLDQASAGENDIGPLALHAGNIFALGDGLVAEKARLAPHFGQSQTAAVNLAVGITREFFLHGGERSESSGDADQSEAPRASPRHLPIRPWRGILSKTPRPRPRLESKGQRRPALAP